MNYHTVSSLKHKVEMALIDFKGDDQKCLSCGDVREAIPSKIDFKIKKDGEIGVELVGSIFTEDNWTELYSEAYDGAPVIGAICHDCAIRRGLKKKEPEVAPAAELPVPDPAFVPARDGALGDPH